jgi:hypothetical protein
VSLARVVAQTPTVRDIGTMAWGHLRHLAPGASLALFTVDAVRGTLVAQCTAGPAAERLSGLTMNVAQRVSGWVAANWQPMMNADAHLDLEAPSELRYVVSIPLVLERRLVAVMSLYAPEAFSDLQTKRLEMVAPHFATALAAADHERPAATRSSNSELRVVSRR